MSDGEWVTLGAHEVDDLEAVVHHLRATFPESTIGLWGRSMGAVTALMYSQRDPSIAGVVSLSSPRPYTPPPHRARGLPSACGSAPWGPSPPSSTARGTPP